MYRFAFYEVTTILNLLRISPILCEFILPTNAKLSQQQFFSPEYIPQTHYASHLRWFNFQPFTNFLNPKYYDLNKRASSDDVNQNAQREIRSPLETMRFGKRNNANLYVIGQYKKREEANPFSTMRFGKRNNQNPLGVMRFGKRNINSPHDSIQYNNYNSPLQTMRFGK